MVSRRSVRIKSTSVLKKLKKRIGSKPKNSVGVQDVNLKRAAAANSQIDTTREYNRTRRSSTSENKQKDNRRSEILTRKAKNVADQEDSRVKSCTVLAVKLKYPYVARTTSMKLNSRSTNKNSSSSRALPRTRAKSPETDLDDQGGSRKSSRMRKPTSKELRSVLTSTDTQLGLEKHNGEVSPHKLRNKSVKPQISNETSIPDQKAQVGNVSPSGKKVKDDDTECVRCGLTPSQFFRRDAEHNTVCCFCSLLKPPQELKALLQLLKLDCCLKFLNQKNQNALENNNGPSRKRRMSEHTTKAGNENATSGSNSDVKTLRERNTVRVQKEHNQNSPEEQKQNTSRLTRLVRQQKGNSSVNLNKLSNAAKSPNSAAVSSTRISTRLAEKTFPRIKLSTKVDKQKLSTIQNIQRNLKRKISPQSTQNSTKRRKLTENVEIQKKTDREHICSSCNSTFAMQWKLKLHELTHTDRSCPNVVLRHAEVENMSDVTNMEGEFSEAIDCVPNKENAADKDRLNVQVSDPAIQELNTITEKLQENETTLDNENSKEGGDDLEPSQAFKQGNEVKSLEDNEKIVNKDISDTQSTEITEAKICDAPANRENTEVNQKSDDGLDSHDITTNCETPLDKDNVEVNEESDVPTKNDENPTSNDFTDQSTKTKKDEITKKPDLSSSFDTNSLSTQEHIKDKEQDGMKSPSKTASSKSVELKENENVIEKSKPLDTVSDEDMALDQSEIQNTVKGLGEVEENVNNEELEDSVKAIEETETHELSKTNEDEHAGEENEERPNEICDNTATEETEMHGDDDVDESSKMDKNCSKESVYLKNSSDDCEQKDDESLVTETESNSENTANEGSSEVGETETKPKHNHEDQHKAEVSENNEKKVNGTVGDDGEEEEDDDDDGEGEGEDDDYVDVDVYVDDGEDESNNAFDSEIASHPEIVVNHAADNISQHPVDENMTELYNQMNMMFEGEPDENQAAKTETEKKSPDHLGLGDNSSESNEQSK